MMMFAVLLALVAGASADVEPRLNELSPTGRIVGGVPITIDKIPYQVSLQVRNSHFCGGTIISDTWILTAGHCMVYSSNQINIRSGSTNSNSGGSVTEVASIITHPNYGTNAKGVPINDIALMKLKSKLALGSTRLPIRMFDNGQQATAGSAAFITGWGALKEGGGVATVLQTAGVRIISKGDCSAAYKDWGELPAGQICAAVPNGGIDACQGDSGGPLAMGGRLAGVVSWGNGCARPGWPGVYTEVASFRSWITQNSGV